MLTDPIADFLIRIKNAQKAGHPTLRVPYSNFKFELAKILEKNGLLADPQASAKQKSHRYLELKLKYNEGRPAVWQVKKISKPGQRIYIKKDELKSLTQGLVILSTSQGLMTSRQAKAAGLGGELICQID